MRIIVFGASGKVGRILTSELLERGHTVTAFVYGDNPFTNTKNLNVIKGDVRSSDEVSAAIEGHEAVLSTLGSWGTKTRDILSSGMRTIIPAMEAHGVKRIVSLTGADARDKYDNPNLLQKLLHRVFSLIARDILLDGEDHIRQLRTSTLDWTVLRSPIMTSKDRAIGYKLKLKLPMPWNTANRSDVAAAMADLAESHQYIQKSPVIWH